MLTVRRQPYASAFKRANGGMDVDGTSPPERIRTCSFYNEETSLESKAVVKECENTCVECQHDDEHPSSGCQGHLGRCASFAVQSTTYRRFMLMKPTQNSQSSSFHINLSIHPPSPACSATSTTPAAHLCPSQSQPACTPKIQRPQTTKRHRGLGEQNSGKSSAALLEIICQLRQSALSADMRVTLCTQFLHLCLLVSILQIVPKYIHTASTCMENLCFVLMIHHCIGGTRAKVDHGKRRHGG